MTAGRVGRLGWTLATFATLLSVLACLPLFVQLVEAHPEPPRALPSEVLEKQYNGSEAIQEFVARGEGITSVALQLATYKRSSPDLLEVHVIKWSNNVWRELSSQTLLKSTLEDNAYQTFEFDPPLAVSTGDRLALKLVSFGPRMSSISWYFTPGWSLPGHRLSLNNELQPGTAHFRVGYRPLRGMAAVRRGFARITGFWATPGVVLALGSAALALYVLLHLTLWSPMDPVPGRGYSPALRMRVSSSLRLATRWLKRRLVLVSKLPHEFRDRWLIPPSVAPVHDESTQLAQLLLVFFLALGIRCIWAAIIPPWTAPDELSHFTYVSHLVEQGEVPHGPPYARRYPDHSEEIDESCTRTACNRVSALWLPRGRELDHLPIETDYKGARTQRAQAARRKSAAGSSATPYEPPYYLFGAAFYRAFYSSPILERLSAVRLASALLSALSCCFGYLFAHEISRRLSLALAVGMAMALAPMPAFVGAAVNNDAALFLCANVVCWLLARVWLRSDPRMRLHAALGIAMAAAWLSKPSAGPLLLFGAGVVVFRSFPFAVRPFRLVLPALKSVSVWLFSMVLAAAPWLLYRKLHAGAQSSEAAVVSGLISSSRFNFSDYLDTLYAQGWTNVRWLLVKSFWALFGWQEIALSERAYDVILGVIVLAACGLLLRMMKLPDERRAIGLALSAVAFQLFCSFVLMDYLLSYARTGQRFGLQGRYFLPIFAPFLTLIGSGLAVWVRDRPRLVQLLPVLMLTLQALSLLRMLSAYYAIEL